MKNWKQILAPVLVFVLGALAGGGVTALYALKQVREIVQADTGDASQMGMRFIARRLQLDAQQRAAAQPIFDDIARGLADVRVESMPRVRRLINEADGRLRPILRPDQQRKLDRLLALPRARWERMAPMRPNASGPAPAPPTPRPEKAPPEPTPAESTR
jgi:hypothetical protein